MGSKPTDNESAPSIELRQLSVEPLEAAGHWRIGWRVANSTDGQLILTGIGVPHGQFKGDDQTFAPPLAIEGGAASQFNSDVHCAEPPGLVTENGFLIFHATWSAVSWRIFARVSVVVDSEGKPHAKTESVTTQKVGFSGVSS
jgi:hypothetical protein